MKKLKPILPIIVVEVNDNEDGTQDLVISSSMDAKAIFCRDGTKLFDTLVNPASRGRTGNSLVARFGNKKRDKKLELKGPMSKKDLIRMEPVGRIM